MNSKAEKFSKWLIQQFLDWQYSLGENKTYADFARFLDINPVAFRQWINGIRTPNTTNIKKIALKLGPEIFEVLEVTGSMDIVMIYLLEEIWEDMSDEYKLNLISDAIKHIENQGKEVDQKDLGKLFPGLEK